MVGLTYRGLEHAMNWKLVRERDGLTKQSNSIKWLEEQLENGK